MSFISDYVSPFLKWYHRIIEGDYLAEALQYKGGKDIGTDYVAKVSRANRRPIEARYDNSLNAVKQPTFGGFLQDNILRLALNRSYTLSQHSID